MHNFFNLLIFFSALNIFGTAQKNKAECKELYIIFVQSDLIDRSASDQLKFQRIWHQYMPNLFSKIMEKENVEIWIYPLNAITSTSNPIHEFNSSLLKGLMRFDRRIRQKEEMNNAWRKHISTLAENNLQQDIIGSIILLNNKKANFIENGTTIIIYISDMIHYNTTIVQTDSERGLFNFEHSKSLRIFENNIRQGFLYGNDENRIEIPCLVDHSKRQTLEIYSLDLPRNDRAKNAVSISRITEVWETLFNALGANKIKLNLSSIDKVLSKN